MIASLSLALPLAIALGAATPKEEPKAKPVAAKAKRLAQLKADGEPGGTVPVPTTGPALPPPATKPVRAQDVIRVMRKYAHEPTVQELQERALRHAAVHPGRLKSLLSRVRYAGVLPEFRARLNKNMGDNRNQSVNGITQLLDDELKLEFRVTWEFDRLIFDKNEIPMARASADMVELRTEILNEVTKLYFERRRIQIEADLDPPADLLARIRNELRIQELTAAIDALTGGALSRPLRAGSATAP